MLYTTNTTSDTRLTKPTNINTYVANNDGLTTISESSHTVTPAKANKRVRANKGPRTSVQRAKDRNRWLDSLYNNFSSDKNIDGLRCAFITCHFNRESKSCKVAQNRIGKWLKDLPFKVESWTSVIEYDQYGLVHAHVVLKADKSVLNHGINYLHNVLIETFKTLGTAHSERIYDLDGLGRYLCLSDTSKAKSVKQAVKDEQESKAIYDTVKGLDVPANVKKQAKKQWRQSHMAKKKAVAKCYEKHGDKIMRKSYGQKHSIKVRCIRSDVWNYVVMNGYYLGSTTTRITNVDELGNEHLVNIVKRDVFRLDNSHIRELQHMLGAIKAYQDANKVVA